MAPSSPTTLPTHAQADRLLELLRDEERLLGSSRDSLNELRTALRRGKMETLKAIVHQQTVLAEEIRQRAEERTQAARELGATFGMAKADCTLKNLANVLSEPWSGLYRHSRERLIQLAAEIQKIKDGNAILLESLRYFFRDVLSSLAPESATPVRYGPSGVRVGSALATGFAGSG